MAPTWEFERQCRSSGYHFVAGVDEVGVGCLAGPVVAAAVILNEEDLPLDVDDSKLLTAKKRKDLQEQILKRAIAYGVAWCEVEEIDRLNILRASQLAMCRAVTSLKHTPDFLLVDGRFRIDVKCPQRPVIKGDRLSVSIAAASILAKVYRDEWMARLDEIYPGYLLAKHKGYASKIHRECLQKLGPSPIHRKSFSWSPV